MENLAVRFKQIYSGVKTIFGSGGARKSAQTVQKAMPKYQGPTITQMPESMPLALPAPSAEALAAARPRVNVGKALNRNLDELRVSQVITKDGTHVRYYRGADGDKILLKTEDKGTLHREWIYGDTPAQLTYIKSTGSGDRYIMTRDGNYVQIEKRATLYKDGINQTTSTNDLYFNDGAGNGFRRYETKGFDGAKSRGLEVRGNVTAYPWKYMSNGWDMQVKAEADAVKATMGNGWDMQLKAEADAVKATMEPINGFRNTAETRFIDDFDEALF